MKIINDDLIAYSCTRAWDDPFWNYIYENTQKIPEPIFDKVRECVEWQVYKSYLIQIIAEKLWPQGPIP